MKPQWLNKSMLIGPYYTLCLSQAELDAELKRLGVTERVSFLKTERSNATTQFLTSEQNKRCCIVCLGEWADRDPITVAGLLVHEATHIWQEWCNSVGERNPGDETMAYAIQWLSQQLMWEFVRRTSPAKAA